MTSNRWLSLGLSLALVAVIGVGAWQVLTTRSQLQDSQTKVQSLTQRLTHEQFVEKTTKNALANLQRTFNAQSVTTTTTTTPLPAPFPFVDRATLLQDLNNAPEMAEEISAANPAWIDAFVNAFAAEEERETALAEEGKTYYIPDPVSEADAYVADGTLP
jgi:hypothetical protein